MAKSGRIVPHYFFIVNMVLNALVYQSYGFIWDKKLPESIICKRFINDTAPQV